MCVLFYGGGESLLFGNCRSKIKLLNGNSSQFETNEFKEQNLFDNDQ